MYFSGDSNRNALWCNVDGICLSVADKAIVVDNKWLSDSHIDAASRLLKRDFNIEGLFESQAVTHRNLISRPIQELSSLTNSAQLMQMHYVNHHWLLSSCVGRSITVS